MHKLLEQQTVEGETKKVLVSVGKYFMEVFDDNLALSKALKERQKSYRFRPSKSNPYYGRNQRMNLIHDNGQAIMILKRKKSEIGFHGIQCTLLLNNSGVPTADLIADGIQIATDNWDDTKFYVYIDPNNDKSKDTSNAFIKAGWRKVGVTKRNYEIFMVELKEN